LCRSETEIKQLNGWKATVENLMERFEDLVKQQQLLMEIDEGQAALHGSSSSRAAAAGATPQGPAAEAAAAAADAAAAAIAAEEGAAGPLAAGSVVPRSSVLTAQHHVQLNKLRCAAGAGCMAADVPMLPVWGMCCGCRVAVERCLFCQAVWSRRLLAFMFCSHLTHHTYLRINHCALPCVLCRQHFHKDVRKQLYSDADDRQFFDRIKCGLKTIEGRLEEGRVALQHLELFLVNVACDDPGATIGSQLVLPLLQVRMRSCVVCVWLLVNVACDDPGATIGSQLVLPLLQVRRCLVVHGCVAWRVCCLLALR
jgi:hypothetical protein